MSRVSVVPTKERVAGASTTHRRAIDHAANHDFEPTNLNHCVLIVTNTTSSEKVATIKHQDSGDDVELTLAAGNVNEQIAVYDFSDVDPDDWLSTGKVQVDIANDMTGFIQVIETKPEVAITLKRGDGDAGAPVELSTLDGTYGVFQPGALGLCMMYVRNALEATTDPVGQNDKKLAIKAGDTGIAKGIGDKIFSMKENQYSQLQSLDSSRFVAEDGKVRVRPQEGVNGTISVMELD